LVAELSQASSSTTNQVIVGATMVLYQSPAHVELEALRAAVIEEAFNAVDTAGSGVGSNGDGLGVIESQCHESSGRPCQRRGFRVV